MKVLEIFLMVGLIVCGIASSMSKKLLTSIIIYMSYSSMMAIVWVLLQSPDLAITEAAVGAGVTSILFFVTLKKIHAVDDDAKKESEQHDALSGPDTESGADR